jgi:hypothetical protein
MLWVGGPLTVLLGVVAGLGDWSAVAIYAGVAVVGTITILAGMLNEEPREPRSR